MPNIKTILEHLSGSNYFSVIDFRNGFWQLVLEEGPSKDITAFSVSDRQYNWNRLPMGLSVSPGIFQSIMVEIFSKFLYKAVICYIDDILLYSKDAESHYNLINSVFKLIREAGLKLHPEKSAFGLSKVEYLGYEIGSFGFRPIQSKIDALTKMARPTDCTQLKSFIGSVCFYTQSFPLLQHTLAPLHKISGKSNLNIIIA